MFDKIAWFVLMGLMGALMVVTGIVMIGAIGFGIYSAYMASPLWLGIGVFLWLVCAIVGQRIWEGEVKK